MPPLIYFHAVHSIDFGLILRESLSRQEHSKAYINDHRHSPSPGTWYRYVSESSWQVGICADAPFGTTNRQYYDHFKTKHWLVGYSFPWMNEWLHKAAQKLSTMSGVMFVHRHLILLSLSKTFVAIELEVARGRLHTMHKGVSSVESFQCLPEHFDSAEYWKLSTEKMCWKNEK